MKKYYFLIIVALILGLVLTGCSLLSNISQVPATDQSGINYLTKGTLVPGNLVGLWHFDGDALDSSGYNNYGTVYGTNWVDGKFGRALSFDGDDYVDCGLFVDDDITTGITLEAWIKPESKQNGGIVSNDITNSSKEGYDFFLWASGTYGRLYIDFGNGRTYWDIPNDDWYNQWHHVAATWDGSVIKLYADGVKVEEVYYSGTCPDPGKSTFIGAINYLTPAYFYFNGIIDEVRIWKEALDFGQIAQSYALGTTTLTEATTVLGEKSLAGGGVAIFTSAFYVTRTPTLPIFLEARSMIVDSTATVISCTERKITPRGSVTYTPSIVTDGVDITVMGFGGGAKSLHLTMDLSIGEGLGFNVQFLPYDYD